MKDAFATNKRDLADGNVGFRSARGGGEPAPATACESDGNLGLRQVIESHSRVNSSMGVASVRPASAAVAPLDAAVSFPCPRASGAAVAVQARNTVTPMHVPHNSGELVVSCQCRGPPTAVWVVVDRVPRAGGVPKVGSPVRPKIYVLSQRWSRGKFSAGRLGTGGRLQVHFPVANQALVPGGSGKVQSYLPSTQRFLIPKTSHLGADWVSGNQWAG